MANLPLRKIAPKDSVIHKENDALDTGANLLIYISFLFSFYGGILTNIHMRANMTARLAMKTSRTRQCPKGV
jgi:hypothetical protein